MTYLEIVNSVLRRLREATVGSVAETTYSALIGELVKEAKREVENSWNWSILSWRNVLTAEPFSNTVTLGSQEFTTYDSQRIKVSRLWHANGEHDMHQVDLETMSRYEEAQPLKRGLAVFWRMQGLSNEQDTNYIRIWPIYSSDQTIYVYGTWPQRDFPSDNTESKLSPYPIILGAYALAIAERGDDRGDSLTKAQLAYEQSLADAVAADASNRSPVETDWRL